MEINRTITEYAKPSINALGSSIAMPSVNANNFEIRTQVLQMIQCSCNFKELSDEDLMLTLQISSKFVILSNLRTSPMMPLEFAAFISLYEIVPKHG